MSRTHVGTLSRNLSFCVTCAPDTCFHVPESQCYYRGTHINNCLLGNAKSVTNRHRNIAVANVNVYSNGVSIRGRRWVSTAATSKLTWKDHVDDARNALRDADFVAIDVEYTGLHFKDDRYIGLDQCYEAHASGAKQFIPCQVGLTAAKYTGEGLWRITPMSVYTIPSGNKFFKVSTSTLQFLKDNNFDFHSWIHHGVEHLTPAEERERKSSLEQRKKELEQMMNHVPSSPPSVGSDFDLSSLSPEDRSMAEGIIARVRSWISSGNDEPLEIELDSAFQRLLMHTIIGQQFPEVYSHSERRGEGRVICIYKSQVELYQQQKIALEGELRRIDDEIGVRLLFDELVHNNKILVGHNCFYDLLHVYQTFYGDLPDTVDDFRKSWTSKFRNTLDTKYIGEFHDSVAVPQHAATLRGLFDHMCSTEPCGSVGVKFSVHTLRGTSWRLPSGVLPLLCKNRMGVENVSPDCGIGDFESTSGQSHDAGYDSFMTCIIFVLQCGRILRCKHLNWDKLKVKGVTESLDYASFLEAIGSVNNCIRLVKSQPNSINLSSLRQSDMARYFLMSGYPNSWKKWDIMKVWSPLWVSVSVIDETSCWVIVKNDEDIRNINLIYRMMKNPQFTLQTYEQSKQSKGAVVNRDPSG
ncbi:Poly(A)-specific ribonuclease PARN [Babesia sp. Xinjiang]|uniref:Poly(A)-specific ribonuclease PARN n=1 Tax=Babesia sp. Xinjiang TaxID=462227 RepID=UPI000A263A18|nr:Poly(A)-specific ribonuclease PARN [Babesia sp. Xinjiang]XP_028871407.1 Poly(A)-specific ribonuclease PARN [Babesia sp. Xinjiang]ORM40846.1 Poly(A)-specific ribonuclease PARN [Babesia sp. Xinjiang]ORM40951.1 Poly(A)-specific ribonuclease PARN [Babesia sp. Xinjiang]